MNFLLIEKSLINSWNPRLTYEWSWSEVAFTCKLFSVTCENLWYAVIDIKLSDMYTILPNIYLFSQISIEILDEVLGYFGNMKKSLNLHFSVKVSPGGILGGQPQIDEK